MLLYYCGIIGSGPPNQWKIWRGVLGWDHYEGVTTKGSLEDSLDGVIWGGYLGTLEEGQSVVGRIHCQKLSFGVIEVVYKGSFRESSNRFRRRGPLDGHLGTLLGRKSAERVIIWWLLKGQGGWGSSLQGHWSIILAGYILVNPVNPFLNQSYLRYQKKPPIVSCCDYC